MKKLKLFFVSCLLFSQVFCAEIPEKREDEAEDHTVTTFKGHSLLEATPMTPDDLEFLRTLDETVPEDVLDFWSTPVKTEEAVPILVHPDLLPHVKEAFQVGSSKLKLKLTIFFINRGIKKASLFNHLVMAGSHFIDFSKCFSNAKENIFR